MSDPRPGYITMFCASCCAFLRTIHGYEQGGHSTKCEPRCSTAEERARLIETVTDALKQTPTDADWEQRRRDGDWRIPMMGKR